MLSSYVQQYSVWNTLYQVEIAFSVSRAYSDRCAGQRMQGLSADQAECGAGRGVAGSLRGIRAGRGKMPPSLCGAFGVLRELFDLSLDFLNHFLREIAGKEDHAVVMPVAVAHFCGVGIFNHQG